MTQSLIQLKVSTFTIEMMILMVKSLLGKQKGGASTMRASVQSKPTTSKLNSLLRN